MKRFLLILIFLKIAFVGYSQGKEDTICFTLSIAAKKQRQADSLQICKIYTNELNKLVIVMEYRIKVKDSTIEDLKKVVSDKDKIIASKNEEIKNVELQRDKTKEDMNYYKKLLRKQKAKTWFTAGGGLAAIVGLIFLLK